MCVVKNNSKGFIITTYITDRIKEGVQIWKKSE
jgi:molybdopterin synthase catalytic subunit